MSREGHSDLTKELVIPPLASLIELKKTKEARTTQTNNKTFILVTRDTVSVSFDRATESQLPTSKNPNEFHYVFLYQNALFQRET